MAVLSAPDTIFMQGLPSRMKLPQLKPRSTTHYWNLGRGSYIAYMHIAAKGIKKPYPIIYLHGGSDGCSIIFCYYLK